MIVVVAIIAVVVLLGPAIVRALIRRRLRGYRVIWEPGGARRDPPPDATVAVIGGGLAGIAAATTLAEAGLKVTIFEAQPYLGGKLGAWPATLPSGETIAVSHGFHAFFRHYYNLDAYLVRLGLRQRFVAVDDYLILEASGRTVSFRGLSTTPALNLLALAWRGVYRFSDVIFGPARDLMGVFLEYDEATTFARYDRYTLQDFDRIAQLPAGLKLSFRTFARAFFADADRISLAEVIKSFHFYYLGHDRGLLYDHPVEDYEAALWAPIRAHLARLGVEVLLSTPVDALGEGLVVNGRAFDHVVLAADAAATRKILSHFPDHAPALAPGQRYAVLRVFADKDVRAGLPIFVVTDRVRLLDSVTLFHRFERESMEQVARHGGSVLELHCYAVPDDLPDEQVRGALLYELVRFFPELGGLSLRGEVLHIRSDFSAFHAGMHARRPTTVSGIPGVHFAGDWVKLPFPAMLLEAAFASGLLAANDVLDALGLPRTRIDCVPPRGLMAGMPEPPARKKLLP